MATLDLCTTAQVKADLEITVSTWDTLIASLISSASVAIMRRSSREFAPQTSASTRDVRATGRVVDLAPYEVRTVTSVVLDPASANTTLTTSQYQLVAAPNTSTTSVLLRIGESVALPYALTEFGGFTVRIVGDWGAWSTATVPDDVRRACIVTVGSWMDRAVAEYGVDTGDGRGVSPASAGTWAVPGAAYTLLQPYLRMVV